MQTVRELRSVIAVTVAVLTAFLVAAVAVRGGDEPLTAPVSLATAETTTSTTEARTRMTVDTSFTPATPTETASGPISPPAPSASVPAAPAPAAAPADAPPAATTPPAPAPAPAPAPTPTTARPAPGGDTQSYASPTADHTELVSTEADGGGCRVVWQTTLEGGTNWRPLEEWEEAHGATRFVRKDGDVHVFETVLAYDDRTEPSDELTRVFVGHTPNVGADRVRTAVALERPLRIEDCSAV